jgi:prepilin-type N-terminal cleavage/methylation domain-containing protein
MTPKGQYTAIGPSCFDAASTPSYDDHDAMQKREPALLSLGRIVPASVRAVGEAWKCCRNSSFGLRRKLMTSSKHRGFSLLEMMVVMGIGLILAAIVTTTFIPLTNQQHMTSAYNSTLGTLRRAHDQAAADMRIYVVTFTAPNTITVQQAGPGNTSCQIPPTGAVLTTTTLPTDVSFQVEPGVPTSNTTAPTTPDQMGTATLAIDLDEPNAPGSTSVCFNPDGTATDVLGNTNNGVIYLGRTGDLYSARAITLWGTTGRIRGWRLFNVATVNTWRQQ